MPYNNLDADTQVTAEEQIAALIFLYQESVDADGEEGQPLTEEDCAELGRMILLQVLEEFRPDLFDSDEDGEVLPGNDEPPANSFKCRHCKSDLHFPTDEFTRDEVLQKLVMHAEECTGFKGLPTEGIFDNYTWDGQ